MRLDGNRTVAVVAGGQALSPGLAARVGDVDYVIAADSGLHAAEGLGLTADLVVGDLDSVDPASLDRPGLEVERHPAAKDHTDIVLALDRACDLGAGRVVVVSGGGGRLDHALANLLVLASPRYEHMQVRALIGDAEIVVVRDHHRMQAPAGTVVSLFAVGGPALGVTTHGLRYPLDDEVLDALSSRGVSNEFVGGHAAVHVTQGVLLVIRPGGERRDTRGGAGTTGRDATDGRPQP